MWIIEDNQAPEHLWCNCHLSNSPEIKEILIATDVIKSQRPEMENNEKKLLLVTQEQQQQTQINSEIIKDNYMFL